MNAFDHILAARIGRALGSERVIALETPPGTGPLELLQLRARVGQLQASGPTEDGQFGESDDSRPVA